MRRFMTTNEVTHNLMSFSGFKSLLIFSMLVEAPQTYEDIQKAVENNEYLRETMSFDTIRIYMNSLKKVGCNITAKKDGRKVRYHIDSHPFELKISDQQVKSILKIYKAIAKNIEISDFMALQNFFLKISPYITNEKLKQKIENISPLSNIDSTLIKDLMQYAKSNTQITILYNSPHSGRKNIDILADKISINNGKLYLSGVNSEYKNYYSFLVSKIVKIVGVNIDSPKLKVPELTVRYEYYKSDNATFEPTSNEKIINQDKNKIVVDITSKNKFVITQRILSFANNCKVIAPQEYRQEFVDCLKKMKEGYFDRF